MTTTYEVEAAPGQPRDAKFGWSGSGFRVIAITGERRHPMLTRFRKREHAVEEAVRLQIRDAALYAMAPYLR